MSTYAILHNPGDKDYTLLKIGTNNWSTWQDSIEECFVKGVEETHPEDNITTTVDFLTTWITKESEGMQLVIVFEAESLPTYKQFIELYPETLL